MSRKGVWAEIRKSVLYFGDNEMSGLLVRMEQLYNVIKAKSAEGSYWLDISIDTNPDIRDTTGELDEQLIKLRPRMITLAAEYIRSHPGEFANVLG